MQKAKLLAVNLTAKAYPQAAKTTVSFNLNNLPLCPYAVGAVYSSRRHLIAARRLLRIGSTRARQPARRVSPCAQ